MSLQIINFGTERITYYIEYSKRKTLEINVLPDLSIKVKAPLNSNIDKIEANVRKRAYWLIKQKSNFASYLTQENSKKYRSGEAYWYLGKQYRLKLIEDKTQGVKLKQGYLYVSVKDKANTKAIETLINEWYREHARIKFKEKALICYSKLKKYGIDLPSIKIIKMSKRWGSYTVSGNITLNLELIKMSSYCIEYVIMHELCHIKHRNHSKDFYSFLEQVMPDYVSRKNRLEKAISNISSLI